RGQRAKPGPDAGVHHHRYDDVGLSGMADDFGDAGGWEPIVAGEHHDVQRLRNRDTLLVGTAEIEIHRIVYDANAGVCLSERLHPFQRAIRAAVVDQNDFVSHLPAYRPANRIYRRRDVVLLVEARHDETDPGLRGHLGSDENRLTAIRPWR